MKKVYVWTLPTRIFHALLVFFVLGGFITSEWEEWLSLHVAFGSAVGVLVIYRIIWGFFGPRYSRFGDFNLSLPALKRYLLGIFNPDIRYVGHNPAAGFTMIGILIVIVLLGISGLLTYGVQENRGIFAFLHDSFFREMELFEELHEALGTLLWLLIGGHVAGVLLDRLLHAQERTLNSIVDGYKNLEGDDASLNWLQKLLAVVGIGLSIALFLYVLAVKGNPLTAAHHVTVDYEQQHPLFVSECASCHTLYPPSLLPERSWRKMMADLEHHFGDDASLDPADRASIEAYLVANAAEGSSSEASFGILKSMENMDMIAVTQTPYWKQRHQNVDTALFDHARVKSRANCKACHTDIEQGLLEDSNIRVPRS